MDLVQQIGTSFAAALVCLLALIVVFLVGTLGLQYLRMRKARPRDKALRAEAAIREQMTEEGFTSREVDDALAQSRADKQA